MKPLITNDVIRRFDSVLARGLIKGVGTPDGQMCIEAAVCYALNLPHGDNPPCVAGAVRAFKITLNDSDWWRSTQTRAKGLRDLGIAQIGSKGVVADKEFATTLAIKTVQILLPTLFEEVFPGKYKDILVTCRKCSTLAAAEAAAWAAEAAARDAKAAAGAAAWDAWAAAWAAAEAAAWAARAAKAAAEAARAEKYLVLSANIALSVLKELNSPGCAWI